MEPKPDGAGPTWLQFWVQVVIAFGSPAVIALFELQGTTLGWLLLIPTIAALIMMTWTAYRLYGARALPWQRKRLIVSPTLVEDSTSHESRQFRVLVKLRKGEGDVRAFVEKVWDATGRPLSGFVALPVQLHWTHHDWQPAMRLSAAQASGDTFGVCAVRLLNNNQRAFVLTGTNGFDPGIPRFFEDKRMVWVLVGVTLGGEREARWFWFQPDEAPPMFCRWGTGTPPSLAD